MSACLACLRRQWLTAAMANHIEHERSALDSILTRSDNQLISLLGGAREDELAGLHADFGVEAAERARLGASDHGVHLICQHAGSYPSGLRDLGDLRPQVIAVNGTLERLGELIGRDAVAIVGTRRPTKYGLSAARRMAAELAAAGLVVISGMAVGIDSAAHSGAIAGGGRTIAVLGGRPDEPYPRRNVRLFAEIGGTGLIVSEFGPGAAEGDHQVGGGPWRWSFQARNRIIAALARVVVVVEAPRRSGALITARYAQTMGRWICPVPGQVGVPQAYGPNLMLAKATTGRDVIEPLNLRAVRDAQDVLDLLYGEGTLAVSAPPRAAPTEAQARLLAAISEGADNVAKLEATALVDLMALELKGWVSRRAGGVIVLLP